MEQKRFLTAGEVFQLFGVDADSLDVLVASGAVKALVDLGTFKYRSEDFAALVKDGKLIPRTSGEMFQVDSKGEIPFLKIKGDDHGLKFDDEVSFLELDEEALTEQANLGEHALPTPIVPGNWFEDDDESVAVPKASDTSGEVHIIPSDPKSDEEQTDFELNIGSETRLTPDSDSDVQIIGDDATIDFDELEVSPTGSDSDVRLEGPISSLGSPPVLHPKKPDSDSDVRLSKPVKGESKSDSDVTVVAPVAGVTDAKMSSKGTPASLAQSVAKKLDGDSDVQLVTPAKSAISIEASDSDSDVVLVGTLTEGSPVISAKPFSSDEPAKIERGLKSASNESGIAATPEGGSDIALETAIPDSGITLDTAKEDSGIALEPINSDSGIALESAKSGSDIALDSRQADSGIRLGTVDPDSGIALNSSQSDSGIMLEKADSGIRFEPSGDSGISLSGTDSGITFEDDVFDPSATLANDEEIDFAASVESGHDLAVDGTQTLDLSDELPQDSGFDVSLADPNRTTELRNDDGDNEPSDSAATVVKKGRQKGTPQSQVLSLSEAFKLDEPLEVEDLEISDDLDSAATSDFSGEFAAVEEDVLEASDADFSGEELSVAEEEEFSDSEADVPAAKVRAAPREPAWGILAGAPIICASVLMAVTVTVLWGGVATMWTGGEAPGPAGMLISALAGLF